MLRANSTLVGLTFSYNLVFVEPERAHLVTSSRKLQDVDFARLTDDERGTLLVSVWRDACIHAALELRHGLPAYFRS